MKHDFSGLRRIFHRLLLGLSGWSYGQAAYQEPALQSASNYLVRAMVREQMEEILNKAPGYDTRAFSLFRKNSALTRHYKGSWEELRATFKQELEDLQEEEQVLMRGPSKRAVESYLRYAQATCSAAYTQAQRQALERYMQGYPEGLTKSQEAYRQAYREKARQTQEMYKRRIEELNEEKESKLRALKQTHEERKKALEEEQGKALDALGRKRGGADDGEPLLQEAEALASYDFESWRLGEGHKKALKQEEHRYTTCCQEVEEAHAHAQQEEKERHAQAKQQAAHEDQVAMQQYQQTMQVAFAQLQLEALQEAIQAPETHRQEAQRRYQEEAERWTPQERADVAQYKRWVKKKAAYLAGFRTRKKQAAQKLMEAFKQGVAGSIDLYTTDADVDVDGQVLFDTAKEQITSQYKGMLEQIGWLADQAHEGSQAGGGIAWLTAYEKALAQHDQELKVKPQEEEALSNGIGYLQRAREAYEAWQGQEASSASEKTKDLVAALQGAQEQYTAGPADYAQEVEVLRATLMREVQSDAQEERDDPAEVARMKRYLLARLDKVISEHTQALGEAQARSVWRTALAQAQEQLAGIQAHEKPLRERIEAYEDPDDEALLVQNRRVVLLTQQADEVIASLEEAIQFQEANSATQASIPQRFAEQALQGYKEGIARIKEALQESGQVQEEQLFDALSTASQAGLDDDALAQAVTALQEARQKELPEAWETIATQEAKTIALAKDVLTTQAQEEANEEPWEALAQALEAYQEAIQRRGAHYQQLHEEMAMALSKEARGAYAEVLLDFIRVTSLESLPMKQAHRTQLRARAARAYQEAIQAEKASSITLEELGKWYQEVDSDYLKRKETVLAPFKQAVIADEQARAEKQQPYRQGLEPLEKAFQRTRQPGVECTARDYNQAQERREAYKIQYQGRFEETYLGGEAVYASYQTIIASYKPDLDQKVAFKGAVNTIRGQAVKERGQQEDTTDWAALEEQLAAKKTQLMKLKRRHKNTRPGSPPGMQIALAKLFLGILVVEVCMILFWLLFRGLPQSYKAFKKLFEELEENEKKESSTPGDDGEPMERPQAATSPPDAQEEEGEEEEPAKAPLEQEEADPKETLAGKTSSRAEQEQPIEAPSPPGAQEGEEEEEPAEASLEQEEVSTEGGSSLWRFFFRG